MPKLIPAHLRDEARKCSFCNEPGRSRTHIWPEWLNKLLKPPQNRRVELIRHKHKLGEPRELSTEGGVRQGSIFNQKPYLVCDKCNTGWMKDYEDEMQKFALPLFTNGGPITLSGAQMVSMANWCALIATLAEFTDPDRMISHTAADREYLRTARLPPEHWTVVVANQTGTGDWYAKYRRSTSLISDYTSVEEFRAMVRSPDTGVNTSLSSFGMGKLFAQVFICPKPDFYNGFRVRAAETGMNQLWPIPSALHILADGLPKFPTKLVIEEQIGDLLADAYMHRIDALVVTPEKVPDQ